MSGSAQLIYSRLLGEWVMRARCVKCTNRRHVHPESRICRPCGILEALDRARGEDAEEGWSA
ncbi:hypothetical protein LCGC14_0722840 [marine sediment metagenome]|uniref:Uncharacterized protein n=1 Tax=marine sediment metagenome TaxID=412755 RepID=A0A0F9QBV3_9ZZZZ